MSRRLARELALKALFQIDVGKNQVDKAIEYILEDEELSAKDRNFLTEIVTGVTGNLQAIDEIIAKNLIQWDIKRIPNVDRNILRQAVFELLYREDIPDSVSINEAIELAKVFGTDDSPKFINGVLDKVVKSKTAEVKV